jgi:hypothetical protein
MSKIITKKDLDLVVENTLKEAGLLKEDENAKPDFLDLDGDGDKEEPMKKAAKEKEENVEETVEEVVEETDIVQESVDNLVEEFNKQNINEGLSNEIDNFKRFINYNNY